MSELSSNQNSNVTEDSKQSSQTLTGSRKGRFFFKKQKCDITNPSADKQKTANKNGSDGNPSECSHQIIIKDMCGTCGKDLRMYNTTFFINYFIFLFTEKAVFQGKELHHQLPMFQ